MAVVEDKGFSKVQIYCCLSSMCGRNLFPFLKSESGTPDNICNLFLPLFMRQEESIQKNQVSVSIPNSVKPLLCLLTDSFLTWIIRLLEQKQQKLQGHDAKILRMDHLGLLVRCHVYFIPIGYEDHLVVHHGECSNCPHNNKHLL